MLKLTLKQLEALPIIEWLFDTDAFSNTRATGRTTVLAYYFINKAIQTGKPIELFDHFPGYQSIKYGILPRVLQILKDDYSNKYEYSYSVLNNTIRVTPKHTWEPVEDND